MRSNTWLWLFAIAMLGALAWGLEQVAFTPLQTGEVYPAFSSLRSDPQGAKALYESLAALPGLTVDRLYKRRQTLENSSDAMFILGVDPIAWSGLNGKVLVEYEKLVHDGGRLVIAFLPVRTPPSLPKDRPVDELWHVKLKYRAGDDDYSTNGIPHSSALFFETGPGWRTLASTFIVQKRSLLSVPVLRDPSDRQAEAVEKTFGAGTIVLVADTYPLSNEGLRNARDAGMISEVAGPSRHITFDENHFGVSETGSVTKLMRRYRLQGAVVVLIVVAVLFLWRSASSLLPPRESGDPMASSRGVIAGRDSLDGLAALLHRGVPEKQLLDACFAEWSKSGPRRSSESVESRAARVAGVIKEEMARKAASAPVAAYRAACRILTEKT